MIKALVLSLCLLSLACSPFTTALPEEGLFVRVVDVGAGLCCVVKMPGDRYMIYDAGNYEWNGKLDKGRNTYQKIQEIIPKGSTVDLLVLSHSDADHLGAVPDICKEYHVRRVVRPGYAKPKSTATWKAANAAIESEVADDGCEETNLNDGDIDPGMRMRFGSVSVIFVCGWNEPPAEWGLRKHSPEYINAGSIVVRLLYKKKSILFCGDTVGRDRGGATDQLIAAEKFMVENKSNVKVDSDVVIAPHHGADNGSSSAFTTAVSPEYVIFSAGHEYDHPRGWAAARYLAAGVKLANIFRTDREDDESQDDEEDAKEYQKEWDHGRKSGHEDSAGDDDVDITISSSGKVEVKYRN